MLRLLLLASLVLPLSAAADDADDLAAGIDRAVAAHLARIGAAAAPPCDDAAFVRRVHLDAIGLPPTPAAARAFIADRREGKRARLIDALLEREEHAELLAMRWGDVLRVASELPANLWPRGAQAYHRWILAAQREDMPGDRFAGALIAATGSGFTHPAADFSRGWQEDRALRLAEHAALAFLGIRSDGDAWTDRQWAGLAACFAGVAVKPTREWKEQIVVFDPAAQRACPDPPRAPDGTDLGGDGDPRPRLAAWLAAQPGFARCHANRLWWWMTGRGLIHPPDDLHPGQAAACEPLLALLAERYAAGGFRQRGLLRGILRSAAYQRAAGGEDGDGLAAALPRRLDAEVIADSLAAICGDGERYGSRTPEPYTVFPAGQRAAGLGDGSIESPFLALFGRPPRATGLSGERERAPSVAQAQTLLNADAVLAHLRRSRFLRTAAKLADDEAIDDVWMRILVRPPRPAERAAARAHLRAGERAAALEDLAWAAINTAEFQIRP